MVPDRWKVRAGGLSVALLTLVILFVTEPRLAIVWDEGYTLGREARLRTWARALASPAQFAKTWVPPTEELVQAKGAPAPSRAQIDTRAKLFDPAVLAYFWPFAREEPHGHPPFYALLGLIGDALPFPASELARARFGTMLLFSAAAGVVLAFAWRAWGLWPGLAAAGAWVLQPRLFAHAHYATYDAILTSLWVCAIAAFARAVEPSERPRSPRWGWVIVFGLIAGSAADTKLTGWLLPIPFVVWSLIYRDRRGLLTLVFGGVVAVVLLYLINPPWWTEPITGVVRFFTSNLNRASSIPIKTLFLGEVYETPNGSLPWYNTVVWTVFVTPVGFLLLALAGTFRAVRRWKVEPIGLLLVGHWAFLLLLRALPHTPGHDGERQFLPAFGVLALLAGPGALWAIERWKGAGRVLTALAIAEGALSVVLMMPVPLSYYSPIVGALPGAARLGMEPTYYWDSLSDESLTWLNRNTSDGDKVLFATNPTSWLYLKRTGKLRPDYHPLRPGKFAWYVVQNRPGALSRADRQLVASARPAFVVRKWGVPLLWVYRYDDLERVFGGGG